MCVPVFAEFDAAVNAALAPGATFIQQIAGTNSTMELELTKAFQQAADGMSQARTLVFGAPPPSM
jgi:hypothetical protein